MAPRLRRSWRGLPGRSSTKPSSDLMRAASGWERATGATSIHEGASTGVRAAISTAIASSHSTMS
ncbi:MAG TPA: hypothetical protein VNM91_00025 [Dehalococcoidia bacterium]|nr:hypothetical protein [Dehalococcoidia bacterium]